MMCGKTMANMTFDKSLALAFSRDKMIAEACYAVLQLKREEATYCSAVSIYNMSKLDDCLKLAGTLIVPCLASAISTGPILCTQLAVAALCNFSRFPLFHEQITNMVSQNLIRLLSSPQVDFSVKLDIIHTLYNIVTDYTPARSLFVEHGIVSSLVKVCKSIDNEDTLACVGRILRELCQHTEAIRVLISEGIMPLLLRLSKLEIATLKIDIADALYTLSATNESLKLLKLDVIHILFWLTLYDCLSLNDVIMKYVSKTLRNFTIIKEDAAILCEEERFFHVIKALSKKGNSENVVWQTAAVIYNLLNINNEIRAVMVKRNVVQVIFDLAICGYTSVMHLCSASLHTVTDHIPNVENPIVLELITSLLDAESDQLSQLLSKTTEDVGYSQLPSPYTSDFSHDSTGFKGTWSVLTCDLDSEFKPTRIEAETSRTEQVHPANLATAVKFDPPVKIEESTFNGFNGETPPNPPLVPPLVKSSSLTGNKNAPRRVSTLGEDSTLKKARFKGEEDKIGEGSIEEDDGFESSCDDGYSSDEQSRTRTEGDGDVQSDVRRKASVSKQVLPQHTASNRKSTTSKRSTDRSQRKNTKKNVRDTASTLPTVGIPVVTAPTPPRPQEVDVESGEAKQTEYYENDKGVLKSMASRGNIQIMGRSSSTGHLGGKLGENKGHIYINQPNSVGRREFKSKNTQGTVSGENASSQNAGVSPQSPVTWTDKRNR